MEEISIAQLECNTSVNYAAVPGTPGLPFLIELDTLNSILEPGPDENQRFCYRITGIGQDTSAFRDLSHTLFGICDQITEDQIVNVTVTIDGVEQHDTAQRVSIVTADNPDQQTGCTGLKFDYGLNKVGGVMEVCYELTTPFAIGPNVVCMFGGGVTRNSLSICGPVCGGEQNNCETSVFQKATVCVPVSVRPFAVSGPTNTVCCGEPTVVGGTNRCGGTPNGVCRFTLTQDVCIAVPVFFGATARPGTPFVECGEVSNENICADCDTLE